MISLDEAKSHLRVDHGDDDTDIALKLKFSEAIVANYISQNGGNDPDIIDAATFLVLGELYLNRESGSVNALSPNVKALLERLRTPTLA